MTAGVNVGQRESGMYELTAYGLGHSLQEVWTKRKASDAPGYEPGTEAFQVGVSASLYSILGEGDERINIVILKVIDKATGKRLTELEDDVGQIAAGAESASPKYKEGRAKTEGAIELTGKELGNFPDTEKGKKALRNAAKDQLETMVGTWVPCPALGGDVEIRKIGAKKLISTSADTRKLRLVAALDSTIGSGRKLASRPPYDGDYDKSARAYHTLRTELTLAGESIAVRTVVKEDTNGKFHYDMTVHALDAVFDSAKDEGRDGSRPPNVTTTNGGGTYPSRFARHQLD